MKIYPWQLSQWQQLISAKQDNRLPHALLLTGIAGTGKKHFADQFCRAMLCQKPLAEGESCGQCHACKIAEGRAHPNVLWIEPEKEGQAIKVDQIRFVSDFINQSSLQGEYRVVLIHPANNMNVSAANALLKTLEEPSTGALLILVSNQSNSLPATILSRCQHIHFPRPKTEDALKWLGTQKMTNPELLLSLANGAPLAALELNQDDTLSVRESLFQALYTLSQKQGDPVKLASSFSSIEPLRLLDFMLSWIMDLVRMQLNGKQEGIINQDMENQLLDLTKRTDMQHNVKFMEFLQHLRGQLARGLNLNKQLVIESSLIFWRS